MKINHLLLVEKVALVRVCLIPYIIPQKLTRQNRIFSMQIGIFSIEYFTLTPKCGMIKGKGLRMK